MGLHKKAKNKIILEILTFIITLRKLSSWKKISNKELIKKSQIKGYRKKGQVCKIKRFKKKARPQRVKDNQRMLDECSFILCWSIVSCL